MNFVYLARFVFLFLVCFAFAVPWSGLAYFCFHVEAGIWKFLATVALGGGIWMLCVLFPVIQSPSEAKIVGAIAGGFLLLSAIQATIERSLEPHLSWLRHWLRAFCIQIASLSWGLVGGITFIVFVRLSGFLSYVPQPLAYITGVLLTPLSISMFRLVVPQLRLRPGIDRSLEAGDEA